VSRHVPGLQPQPHVGYGSYVDPSVQFIGADWVHVGNDTIVSEQCWFNVNHRDATTVGVFIGDNGFIGRRNFFTCGTHIKLGAFCLTGVDCRFLGAGHVHGNPFVPYLTAGTTRGTIDVGDNCWLGANVTVMSGITIGFGSIIGAGSLVREDVPPFSLVAGAPGRVIKRFHPQRKAWFPAEEGEPVGLPSAAEYGHLLGKFSFDVAGFQIAASSRFGNL